eukprot:42126_1
MAATQPEIPQQWIYIMMVSGLIGVIIHLTIITISTIRECKNKQNKQAQQPQHLQIALHFIVWICNFIACVEWASVRTSLFMPLSPQTCQISYISNYLFYMIGKYALHILLLYRLYFVFRETHVRFKQPLVYVVFAIITITFVLFTTLWFYSAIHHVTVGVAVPDGVIQICTMFNSNEQSNHPVNRLWPILFGGQDLLIGLFTLALFFYKVRSFRTVTTHIEPHAQDGLYVVMRKLVVLGTISIASTFFFYTFAIPFYANLTFLLPVDACINSVCTFLLLGYAGPAYKALCCACERVVDVLFAVKAQMRRASSAYTVSTRTEVELPNPLPKLSLESLQIKSHSDINN